MRIDEPEAIDIDEYSDLTRARAGARPSRIQLRYVEGTDVGSGHRRRCEALAVELGGHHVVDCVPVNEATLDPRPDMIVFDVLDDVHMPEVVELRRAGVKTLALEARGPGALECDAVVNELYKDGPIPLDGFVGVGPKWSVLRPEFLGHPARTARTEAPYTIVVSFGGTDPANVTERVVRVLAASGIPANVRAIVPPSRPSWSMDVPTTGIVTIVSLPIMAAEFLAADLAITSAGRTVHEAAACGVPVIAVAVNEREALHDVCPGVLYVGMNTISDEELSGAAQALLADTELRERVSKRAHAAVDGLGAQRIAWLIDGLLGNML
jgi:spore coat polysaccharide biosynthesis predicted glycosyltransferase SpsG